MTQQDTKRHKKLELYKKSGVARTRTHNRGSVPLRRPMLYHCATGLTQQKLVKIKIIYRVGGILCCMMLGRVLLRCMVLCHVMSIGESTADEESDGLNNLC